MALTACSGTAEAEVKPGEKAEIGNHSLVFAHITAESFPYQAGALKFKELLEKQTDGKMTVKVYPGGQLGGERDINESILTGSVHIGVGAGALATLAPIMNLLEMPFMIQDQDHMNRIIDSPVGDKLAAKIQEQGKFKVLDWFSTGDSSIETTDVAIKTPADMKGLGDRDPGPRRRAAGARGQPDTDAVRRGLHRHPDRRRQGRNPRLGLGELHEAL